MALPLPYSYIQCPCSDQAEAEPDDDSQQEDTVEDEDRTFDPRAPRSNYSLFPLEHLMYCEDCQQIRCPRCVSEEIVTFYCPACLMEVPSSTQRSEGNRCTRSCYQCPNCIAPLQVSTLQAKDESGLLSADGTSAAAQGPYALICTYCNWASTEVGIEFDRPSGIHSQLAKLQNGGQPRLTAKDVKDRRNKNPDEPMLPDEMVDAEMQFANLRDFYQAQLGDAKNPMGGMSLGDNMGFSSPAALSRIMSLYTGRGHQGDRAQHGHPDTMRESRNTEEGMKMAQLDESSSIKKLMAADWDTTLNKEQRSLQMEQTRFQVDMRPIPCLLRTKRSKRCPVCRHIITKPENKVTSTRFKIRLVAKSYIPTTSIRPLHPTAQPIPVTSRPMLPEEELLKPLKTYQYVVTFKNPLFENVKVTLAAPNKTPGRFSSNITVLCPQFEIDANIDMWDDALRDDAADDKKKNDESNGQAAAGKVWERGRNWVSIIVEVVPPSLRTEHLDLTVGKGEVVDRSPLRDGEDVVEIPMFVRLEWEADAQHEVGSAPGRDKEAREKRELAYWCVLGVGRVSRE
ncbi:dynactin subunit [Sarocladium strictum]